jgi:hypothetical protein
MGDGTHCFFVICVGASAVSPDVVYANDHGEHGKENGAERGGLRKGADVLRGVEIVYFSVIFFPRNPGDARVGIGLEI